MAQQHRKPKHNKAYSMVQTTRAGIGMNAYVPTQLNQSILNNTNMGFNLSQSKIMATE